jgi:hypothetical protein
MRKTGNRIALVGVLLAGGSALADVEFYQTVDRNKVGTEDTFRLTIVVGDAPEGATVQFPAPNDFEVLQRSQSTQMSYSLGGGGAGVIKRVQKYTLIMRANRSGKLTIPPAALATAQKTYKTDSITMDVVKGRTQADPPPQRRAPDPFGGLFGGNPFGGDDDDPFGGGFPQGQVPDPDIPRSDSDLFLRASVDKDSVYVGEQVNLTLSIYSRVDLSSVDAVTMPKLDGFWSEDLDSPSQLAPEHRVIGGVPYITYLLRRRALFAVKPGTIEIGAAEADVMTGMLFQGRRLHRKGNALTLKVKPLPKGAENLNVGRWRLSREVSQTAVAVGSPITVTVALEGKGNLKSASMPKLTGPAGLRFYDPSTSDKPMINRGIYGGRRTQEYIVVPERTGVFTLPAVTLQYFNPETNQVEESKIDPVIVNVSPAAGGYVPSPSAGGGTSDPGGGPKNVLAATDLKPLRFNADFSASSRPLWSRPWFVPVAAGPFALSLAFGFAGLIRRVSSGTDPASEKRKKARAARARLAAAEKLRASGKTQDFYVEVEKALLSFLEARLSEPAAGLTREQLELKLAAAGVSADVRARVKSSLDTCDMGRFAPGMGDAAARKRALDEAATAMEAWDAR